MGLHPGTPSREAHGLRPVRTVLAVEGWSANDYPKTDPVKGSDAFGYARLLQLVDGPETRTLDE
jgi:hypothetical protein